MFLNLIFAAAEAVAIPPKAEPFNITSTTTEKEIWDVIKNTVPILQSISLSMPYYEWVDHIPFFHYSESYPFLTAMRSLQLRSYYEQTDVRKAFIVKHSPIEQEIENTVFHGVSFLGVGGQASIFSAKTPDNHEVVLRVSMGSAKDALLGSHMNHSQIKFFPHIYGCIILKVEGKEYPIAITCMEKVECDIEQFTRDREQKITRSMLFEELLGNFLMKKAGVEVGDEKYRNFGLRKVPARIYCINGKNFMFQEGLQPVRLDFDNSEYNPERRATYASFLRGVKEI